MKNLLINYVNGSNQTFTRMTEKEANDFNSELHSHGDWMKFRNTTIRKSNICHIDTWGGTCKDCGYYQETSLLGYGACGNPDRDEEDVVEENRKACEGAIP